MATYSNSAREVEMPNGDVVVLHSAPTGGANTTSNIKKFKYDDNGHVTESDAADAEDLNLSSYSTPTTGTTAIGTSDDIQTAIGKLDHQSQIDQSNILYGINSSVINIVPPRPNKLTSENCTAICDGEGKVELSGTSSTNLVTFDYNDLDFTASGTYHLTGCPANGSSSTYELSMQKLTYVKGSTIPSVEVLAHDYGSGADFEINAPSSDNIKYRLRIVVRSNITPPSAPFYPMVSRLDYSSFQPYAVTNATLTSAVASTINKGVKNVIKYVTPNGAGISNNPNLKVTVDDESGIVSVSGSTVANGLIRLTASMSNLKGMVLSGKPYINDDIMFAVYTVSGDSRVATDNGDGIIAVIPTNDAVRVCLYVYANKTINMQFTPMLCTEAEWAISKTFVPPALPNYDLTRMVSELQKKAVKVYTYHVNPNESDPEDAVTYLDDATGLTPAKMGASTFSYGSWANAWFLPRPCVLKFDGTVDYYLNPNDYSKKTDGTASTIDSSNSTGNVMLEFPKIWVKRVNDGNGARTVSIAPVNVDGTYKCWSNINAEDKEVDHFYLPAYNGTIHSSKMRSLSGVTLNTTYAPNYTRAQEVTAATANNPTGKNLWYTETWADFCLVYDLLYLMGKSLDVQRTFGQGLSSGSETAMRAYVTGTHNAKGLFYGDISGTSTAVKVLGMENLWGCRWHGVAGLINDNGTLKVKMTYGVADGSTTVGYNTTGSGYLNYGSTYGTNGYVKKMQADNTMGYKIIETAGTDATYYCDYYYTNNGISAYALLGGHSGNDANGGFCVNLGNGAANAYWAVEGSLSCRPES